MSVCMLYGIAVYYVLYVSCIYYNVCTTCMLHVAYDNITYGGIAYKFNEINYIINFYYPYNDKITVDYVNSM